MSNSQELTVQNQRALMELAQTSSRQWLANSPERMELSPIKALKSGGCQIALARKEPALMARLLAELTMVVKFVDAAKTLNSSEEIQFTIESLLTKFYHLKFAEWLLVFDKIKRGEFGTYYNRLKCAEFMEAFELYDSEEWRADYFANVNKVSKVEQVDAIDYGAVVSKFKDRMKEEQVKQRGKVSDDYVDGLRKEYQEKGSVIGRGD